MAATKRVLLKEFHGFSIYGTLSNGKRHGRTRILIEIKQDGDTYRLYESIAFVHNAKVYFERTY